MALAPDLSLESHSAPPVVGMKSGSAVLAGSPEGEANPSSSYGLFYFLTPLEAGRREEGSMI